MDKSDIEKFRRHTGQGKTVTIDGDSFYFKPLPLKHLPDLMAFGKMIEKEGDEAMFKRENASTMFEMLKIFVKNSYPALEEEIVDGFVLKNMMILQQTLIELSTNFGGELNEKQKLAIEQLKANQNGDKTV